MFTCEVVSSWIIEGHFPFRVLEPHCLEVLPSFSKRCGWTTPQHVCGKWFPCLKREVIFPSFHSWGFWNVDFFRDVYPVTFMPFIVTSTSQRSTRRSPTKVIPTNVGTSGSLCSPRKFELDTWKLVGFDWGRSLIKISGDSWGHLPSNANDLCYVICSLYKFHGCTRCKLWQSNIGWLEMFWFFHWKIHLHVYIHMCVLTNLRMLTLFFHHVRFHWRK